MNKLSRQAYPFSELGKNFNRLFDNFDTMFSGLNRENFVDVHFSTDLLPADNTMFPAVDIEELKDEYCIVIELAGYRKNDISIEVSPDGNILYVKGTSSSKQDKDSDKRFLLKQRKLSSFVRTFSLGASADSQNIKATHEDGILKVVIPKLNVVKDQLPKENRKIEVQ